MSVIRSASLALILSTSLTLGACSPKDKGKSATKSAAAKMLGLTAPGDDVFARHFDVPARSVSESEAEQALDALSLLKPSGDALNWASKDGSAGNYSYNNLTSESADGMITISSAKLFGAHMDGEVATFDRADFQGVKIFDEAQKVTVTVDALSIARPSPAMAQSIVAALSELRDLDKLDTDLNDAEMSFGALALNNVDISSPEANGTIENVVWGKDVGTNLADMKLEGLSFNVTPERDNEYVNISLSRFIATELRADLYKQLFAGARIGNSVMANSALWGKTFDTVKLEDLDIDSSVASFKTKGFEGKAKQKGQVTTVVQASEPMTVIIKEPKEGINRAQAQAYETFAELGFDKMIFQSSQTSVMDAGADTMELKDGLLTLKDGFELSYKYKAGGVNQASKTLNDAIEAGRRNGSLDALKSITLHGLELRLEDQSIVERALELAGKMQGSSAGALRTQAKLGLRLAPLAAPGVEGEIIGELATALSEFIDGGKTLSIVMAPEAPLPVSDLTNLKKGSLTLDALGLTSKAE